MDFQWFIKWFNSPYYHILYKNRSLTEAEKFIINITSFFNFPEKIKVLDLACGKGRHSIILNNMGFDVLGIDLAKANIEYAKNFENTSLKFKVHDMREIICDYKFDVIFNLFTSFGYFQNYEDNFKVFDAVYHELSSKGKFIFDFMNAKKVISEMIPYEEKEIDGILFKITKSIENGFIKKEIDFEDNNETFHFDEFVRLIFYKDFEEIYKKTGFKLKDIFGDYMLNDFNEIESDRLILILEK